MGFRFDAELWLHAGEGGWHFVTVPDDVSDDIEARASGQARGFGSVRVRVQIGSSEWSTSVFPDTKRQAYVLPIKKPVRVAERVEAGDRVTIFLALLDV